MSNHGMIRLVKQAYGGIARLVFPPSCVFCGIDLNSDSSEDSVDLENELCASCKCLLQPNYAATCRSCGAGLSAIPISNVQKKILANSASEEMQASDNFNSSQDLQSKDNLKLVSSCIHCRRMKIQFQQCYSLGNYEKNIRDAVLRIKSGSSDPLAAVLANLIAEKISAVGTNKTLQEVEKPFDAVIPIPIFWRRRLTRNTIVSELIAQRIAQRLKVPCFRQVLRYSRLTKKQGTLSHTERTKNVAGAIESAYPKKIGSKKILIVDDVMTSGATLNEATKVCSQAGAREVHVAIVARGIGLSLSK